MPKPATSNLVRKILKITGIVLGCFLGLLILAAVLFMTILEPYAERFIKKQILENTEGLYSINFNELNINLFTGTIELDDVLLQPDSVVQRQLQKTGEDDQHLLEIKASRFTASGINIIELILKDKLSIRKLALDSPNINLFSNPDWQKKPGQEDDKKIKFPEFFSSLNIREVLISKGRFTQFSQHGQVKIPLQNLPYFSFQIINLEVDAHEQQDQSLLLDMDDFQFKAQDYQYYSPDNIYSFEAGEVIYSLKNSEFSAENLSFKSDTTGQSVTEMNRFLFDFKIPVLNINKIDLIEVYRSQQLFAENFDVQTVRLKIIENANYSKNADPIEPDEIYNIISPYLNSIKINFLNISEGNFIYQKKIEELITVHDLKNFEISLNSVQIDSTTLFTPFQEFLLKEFKFNTKKYTFLHLPDNYQLTVENIELSTTDRLLKAENINLNSDKSDLINFNNRDVIYTIEASELQIGDLDLIEAIYSSSLDIGNILLKKSKINIIANAKSIDKNNDNLIRDFYENISEYFKEIKVNNINIADLTFDHYESERELKHIQRLDHASILIKGISLDSTIKNIAGPLFPIENLVVNVNNYTYWLPEYSLNLKGIAYSTLDQKLFTRSIELISDEVAHLQPHISRTSQTFYDFSANYLQISGVNFEEIITKEKIKLDQILIHNPDLSILINRNITVTKDPTAPQEALENLLENIGSISVQRIRLENGKFTYYDQLDEIIRPHQLENVSASIWDLYIDQEAISNFDENLPMHDMKISASAYKYRSPDKIYTMKIDQFQYSSLQQILTAHSIQILSDKEANENLKENNFEKANRNLFDIRANKFKVTGLNIIQAFESGNFNMDEIILSEPEVAILQDQNVPRPEPGTNLNLATPGEFNVSDQLAETLDVFRVQDVQVKEGFFKINILSDTITRSQTLEHVSLSIDQLRIASLEAADPLEMFDMEDIQVVVKDYSFLLPDSLYSFEVGELRTSLKDQSLSIDSLKLIPLFENEEFSTRLEFVQDRFDINVPEIKMEGINLRLLFENQDFILKTILIKNSIVEIFRDNNLEMDPDRRPKTLQNLLRQIENKLIVDSLILQEGKLTYSDLPPDRDDPIVLILDDLNLEISNITNDSTLISESKTINIQAATQFMKESKLEVEFVLQLDHPEDLYSYEGTLETMDFDALNSLFENLLYIRIRDGIINKIEFSVEATEHMAEGHMNFFYNDLNLKIMDLQNPGNPRLRHRVGSWLVNNFLIKSNNPTNRGKFRVGDISVERDHQRSVFNHMSGAMMDGVTSSLMPPLVEKIFNFFAED